MAVKAARRPPASKTKPVLVLNGPNLNMLGKRQPEIYGRETLADVEKACRAEAARLGLAVEFAQSNHEGVLVDRIQAARDSNSAIVINAGAYTHTSVALLDALNAAELPAVGPVGRPLDQPPLQQARDGPADRHLVHDDALTHLRGGERCEPAQRRHHPPFGHGQIERAGIEIVQRFAHDLGQHRQPVGEKFLEFEGLRWVRHNSYI